MKIQRIALWFGICVLMLLWLFRGDVQRVTRRHIIQSYRIPELSVRNANPIDVLVFLQQELSSKLDADEPAFLVHPNLLYDLSTPLNIVPVAEGVDPFDETPEMLDSNSSSPPAVELSLTNAPLIRILKSMESQGAFKVTTDGANIVLSEYKSDERPHKKIPESELLHSLTADVTQIVFGHVETINMEEFFGGNAKPVDQFKERFRVIDKNVVTNLLSELIQINKHGDSANATFSGLLPKIVLLKSNGDVVCDISITCNDSSISVGNNSFREDQTIKFRVMGENYADGINRDFVRIVYDLLRKYALEEVERLDRLYNRVGHTNGLYQVLGLEK